MAKFTVILMVLLDASQSELLNVTVQVKIPTCFNILASIATYV